MNLSIVATLYRSEPYINEFFRRASAAAKQLAGDDYEIILVNDDSPDKSLELAIKLTERDSHAVVLDLSRNFGHHKAMMTGLAHANGDLIFLIDSDLEEEPEWLLDFSAQMKQQRCDVVFGVQMRRKGNWFERWSGRLFYLIFKILTDLQLPEDSVTSRLMTRRYVNALLLHQEREVFIAGLWHITGFDQRPYTIRKLSTSATTYTLDKKISIFVKSVTAFSSAPLGSIFYVGVFISLIATIYITFLLVNWLFFAKPLSGWTSVIASIWLLGGMTILFIGVIGIYLSKVFSETKQRPYTIIRQIYGLQRD